ncbi:MAG: radical SAM family heme chaperone HemW [Sedimentisphaeraceae bacterium JB056]
MTDVITKSLYVHIPFCKVKCPYCGFYSKPVGSKSDTGKYINAVIKEIESLDIIPDKIKTIYLGGGTPTILPLNDLYKMMGYLSEKFVFVEEFTIETNPSNTSRINWKELRNFGINRVSVGIQSLINNELKYLARPYKAESIPDYIDSILRTGIDNIAGDLIFAIPGSTIENWKYTLAEIAKLPLKHISAYSLSFDTGTYFTKMKESGKIIAVDDETDREMYTTAIDLLRAEGFEQYEISNFAKDNFKCRHNLTYWRNEGYVGAGASAGSFHNMIRSENIPNVESYINHIENNTSHKTYENKINALSYASETAILQLRTNCGVDIDDFKAKTGFDILEMFNGEISANVEKKLLQIKNGSLSLTPNAYPIADSVLCDFAR